MPKVKKENKQKTFVKPLMGYCLIEPLRAELKTASGIFLPESAQEKPLQGKVISIGEDFVLPNGQVLKAPVKVGEIVVYKGWDSSDIKIEGVDLKLIKFENLVAIIES